MLKRFFCLLVLLVLVAFMLPQPPAHAADSDSPQELLSLQKYLLWQQINAARRNPRQVLDRLNIPVQQAAAVLGGDAWILDQGLPPLAWNQPLFQAAQRHGRDMIDQVYYSHISLDGADPALRIAETGYQAAVTDETLGALMFMNFVELERAVPFLVDNILRDELTGTPGVSRTIFSPAYTEVGIDFFAENLPLLAEQPYVYMFVLDFARPLEPRGKLIVQADPASRVTLYDFSLSQMIEAPLLTAGWYQVAVPSSGGMLMARNADGVMLTGKWLSAMDPYRNHAFDLRVKN